MMCEFPRPQGLFCPRCGQRYYCPCSSCCEKNKKDKMFNIVEPDKEQCGGCGLTRSIDWWGNLEMEVSTE